jgi:hypothetical protein
VAGPATVTGEIVFGPDTPSLTGVTARVLVENVSRTDAAAPVVAETLLDGLDVGPVAPPLEFSVVVDDVDEATHYNVRAHVDADDSGDVSVGDLISTQAHPVLTFGAPDRVAVLLHSVT